MGEEEEDGILAALLHRPEFGGGAEVVAASLPPPLAPVLAPPPPPQQQALTLEPRPSPQLGTVAAETARKPSAAAATPFVAASVEDVLAGRAGAKNAKAIPQRKTFSLPPPG